MRLATPLAIVAVAALISGCGGSSDDGTETGATAAPPATRSAPAGASAKSCSPHSAEISGLRATGLDCGPARQVMEDWQRSGQCEAPANASRSSCLLGPYRCLATATDRGLTVSCARSGQSIAFTVKRG